MTDITLSTSYFTNMYILILWYFPLIHKSLIHKLLVKVLKAPVTLQRNDDDGGGSGHGDSYVMWRVGHTVNIPKGYCKEQRENGGHRSLVDLPFFFVSAWWRLRQSQESTSQDHVCSSPPAMSAEESRIAVTAVFRAVAPGSTPFQDIIRSLRAPRRFWAAPKQHGFWEKDVCEMCRRMGRRYPDWEESQYL